ncbi:MAG TPA: 16S rRNA pseudouridine(516) synthase, partial [Lachnospiraceae bacterium]|nr:16S rRNA pseudouridine(516) synthase [Lachnospiraceae bacterium]
VTITITEGKFHQVKRMFLGVNRKVLYLKRISMGHLFLDKELPLGSYRTLKEDELLLLQNLDK